MIRVQPKPLREYFFKREQQLIAQTDVSFFDARRNLCTPAIAALILAVVLLGFSFTLRTALVLFLTEVGGLAVLFVFTWAQAKRVTLRRLLPQRTLREMDTAEIIVEIKNRSDFSISGLVIDDVFGLAKDLHARVAPETLRSRGMVRLSYKKTCDGGMGPKQVGPLTARLSDPLGIFEFRIVEDTIHEIDVYPKVEHVPQLKVLPSIEARKYGNYEVASRGLSVNFSGIRPYERGDSLRHIAWKISSRGQGLMVKEFERVVSCDVNLVLNLAPQWQIGRHSSSTWEYSKDIALSIVQQQLDLGNTVAFFSDRTFVEAGAGSDHFHYLARHVASLNPEREDGAMSLEPKSPLALYREFYARGSNIIYVVPFNHVEFKQSEALLKGLKAEGFHVTCVLIDANSFWLQFIESISTALLIGAKLMLGIEEAVGRLEREGITTYVAENKRPFREVFRERRTTA